MDQDRKNVRVVDDELEEPEAVRQPGATEQSDAGDARDDQEKLKHNRERLDVNEERKRSAAPSTLYPGGGFSIE